MDPFSGCFAGRPANPFRLFALAMNYDIVVAPLTFHNALE